MKAMGKDEILIARSRKPLRLPNIFNPAARSSSVVVRKTVPHGSNRVYKYKLLPGNNGRVLLACLRKRPWWHATRKSEAATTDFDMNEEVPSFIWEMYKNPRRYKDDTYTDVMMNHLEHNDCLVTKKGLYFCLKAYCEKNSDISLLSLIPRTFYLKNNPLKSGDLPEFLEYNSAALSSLTETAGVSSKSAASASAVSEEKSFKNKEMSSSDNLSFATVDISVVENQNEPIKAINANYLNASNDNLSCATDRRSILETPKKASETIITDNDYVCGENHDKSTKNMESKKKSKELTWILKPASKTNRGFGITVVRGVQNVINIVNTSNKAKKSSTNTGSKILKRKKENPETDVSNKNEKGSVLSNAANRLGAQEGWIVQSYMERPMLVSGRKFDIRCFILVTNDIKRGLKAYFFEDAYVRTSSKKYSLANISDREAHLTNDAVQKNSKNYCKYEEGNKLSFAEWQENIALNYPNAPDDIVEKKFRPEIMRLSAITIAAASEQLHRTNMQKSFELLGYDYMVDDEFNVTLIEINSNPCLEFVCPLLTDIISSLIDNVVKVALDVSFPPPLQGSRTLACDEAITLIKQDAIKFIPIYP